MDRYSFDRDAEASLLQDTFELGESESIVWDCRQRALQASLVALTFFALLADFLLLSCIIPIVPSVLQPRDPVTSELVDEATSIPTSLVFLLFSSKALVQMLTAPFVAAFVRRRGPLLALLLSLLVLAMSATVFGGALCWDPAAAQGDTTASAYGRFALMLAARATQGGASAGLMKAGPLLVAHYTSIEERGQLMAVATTGIALGMAFGPVLGGAMATYAEVWASFLLIGVVVALDASALIATFICFRTQLAGMRRSVDFVGDGGGDDGDGEEAEDAAERRWADDIAPAGSPVLRGLRRRGSSASGTLTPRRAQLGTMCRRAGSPFRSRKALICAGGIFLASAAVAVLEPLVPMYLDETFKWAAGNPMLQGLVFSIATLAYLVATPLANCCSAARCVRSGGRHWIVQCVGLASVALGVALVAFPAHVWEPRATLFPTVAGLILVGASMAVVDAPAQAMLAEIAEAERLEYDVDAFNAFERGGARYAAASYERALGKAHGGGRRGALRAASGRSSPR